MADMPHYCSACGEIHGGHSSETEAVKVAKINADRDIEVARIQRSETRTEAETAIEVAEVEAAAQVEEAVVEAAVLEELTAPPEQAPAAEPEPEEIPVAEPEPPVEEVPAPPETETTKAPQSKGYWSGYSAS